MVIIVHCFSLFFLARRIGTWLIPIWPWLASEIPVHWDGFNTCPNSSSVRFKSSWLISTSYSYSTTILSFSSSEDERHEHNKVQKRRGGVTTRRSSRSSSSSPVAQRISVCTISPRGRCGGIYFLCLAFRALRALNFTSYFFIYCTAQVRTSRLQDHLGSSIIFNIMALGDDSSFLNANAISS